MKRQPFTILGAVLLAACAAETPGFEPGSDAATGGSVASVTPVSTGGTAATGTGGSSIGTGGLHEAEIGLSRLSLFLTDAPAAYEHVWVTIARVEIELDGAWRSVSDEALHFDLLELRGGVLAALGNAVLEPGHIGQIRLHVVDAEVTVAGTDHPLEIPSGTETGIKIPLDEDVIAGASYEMVLDFDALRSVKQTSRGYIMKPVILVQEFELVSSPTGGLGGFGGALAGVDGPDAQTDAVGLGGGAPGN